MGWFKNRKQREREQREIKKESWDLKKKVILTESDPDMLREKMDVLDWEEKKKLGPYIQNYDDSDNPTDW